MRSSRSTFTIMLGDNIYGGKTPADLQKKFEIPYKPLLDAGVQFYASLGNHDDTNERFYKFFNMNGQSYYSFKKSNVQFFVLDTDYLDPKQLEWLEKELANAGTDWKICFFHHPLYSSGAFHGSSTELRTVLEPLFLKYGVQVVFAGHEHLYERVKPQKGIYYFTEGASGELRYGNLRKTDLTAAGFDNRGSLVPLDRNQRRRSQFSGHLANWNNRRFGQLSSARWTPHHAIRSYAICGNVFRLLVAPRYAPRASFSFRARFCRSVCVEERLTAAGSAVFSAGWSPDKRSTSYRNRART